MGVVSRVTLADRVVLFKAEGLGGNHEPRLVADLRQDWPELVPTVLAFDHERAWMLMSDHGNPLWDEVDDPLDRLQVFEDILPLYAQMQRQTTDRLERWIGIGLPDRRVDKLPSLMDGLLDGEIPGGALPIESDLRRAIDACLPDLEDACAHLASTPVPDALDHADLHGGNILVGRGRPRLIDWGDACITHPFASVFVTFQLSFAKIPKDERLPVALRLRDAYLEPWSDTQSPAELRRAFVLATWIAHLTRAMDFTHMLQGMGGELLAEWQEQTVATLAFWQRWHSVLRDDGGVIGGVVSQSYI